MLLALIAVRAPLAAGSRSRPAPSPGLAILCNARLVLLPLVARPVRRVARPPAPGGPWRCASGRRCGAAVVVAPWVVRNEVVIGCPTITTDTRALWKANNPATYDVLARGGWIDDVPELPGVPPWPERAAAISVEAAKAVDECAQASFYRDEVLDFWRDEPGEKARLAVQAVGMLWSPVLSVDADESGQQGLAGLAQRTVEPAFVILLYVLALWGAFLAPRRFVVLAALLLGLNTVMAMVFAGTVRYRAPWDFVLALLAAFALERAWRLAPRPALGDAGRAPRGRARSVRSVQRSCENASSARARPAAPIAAARARVEPPARRSRRRAPRRRRAGRAAPSGRRRRSRAARRPRSRSPAARAPSPRARPCRIPRRATGRRRSPRARAPARPARRDRGTRPRRRGRARRASRAARPRAGRRRRSRASAPGLARALRRARASSVVVALDRDQAPDDREPRRARQGRRRLGPGTMP